MTKLQFWQQKLRLLRGDPAVVGNAPDLLATGADSPFLGELAGDLDAWAKNPVLTHPLQPGAQLRVPGPNTPVDSTRANGLPDLPSATWNDPAALVDLCLITWRRQRDLGGRPGELEPADPRSPDHARYSHRRVAAAACFLVPTDETTRPDAREPCLVRLSLHGVQTFIAESRKTRDLWTACMVFGELVWAAMEPIVEHYGPEAVLYPDLLGNPLMDQWLLRRGGEVAEAVPAWVAAAGAPTAAVPVPNTFTVLVPRGGEGELIAVETLMEACKARVADRWRALVDSVEDWFLTPKPDGGGKSPGGWQTIYRRSTEHPPELSWTALRWPRRMFGLERPSSTPPWLPGRAADAETPAPPEGLEARAKALRPWVSPPTWAAYEQVRTVALRTSGAQAALTAERGFDYPLVHAQLVGAHALTAHSRDVRMLPEEPGEKCTITGRHEALSDRPAISGAPLHAQRQAAKSFWLSLGKDASGAVAERLGGPAALKRYLAKAGVEQKPGAALVQRWNGVGQAWPERIDLTAPFPSTAGLAAGPFLEMIAEAWLDPRAQTLRQDVAAVLDALEPLELDQESQHRLALPRLVRWTHGNDETLRRFLCMEAQYLSPSVLQTFIDAARLVGNEREEHGRRQLLAKVIALRASVLDYLKNDPSQAGAPRQPGETYAILAMDGDGLSKLILGEPAAIAARWRDVLHPNTTASILGARDTALGTSGWEGLLDTPRVMGPSLHASITRALADFTDTIVPWVIEAEFHGRLIYAGGDDLLAMLPAGDVIPAAARLQQLFSAPWVVDTAPETAPWAGRRGLNAEDLRAAPWRFRVPRLEGGEVNPHRWTFEPTLTRVGAEPTPTCTFDPVQTRIFPMLGRAHSLSGGAALGHFKTPLGALLAAARDNLETHAKRCTRERLSSGRTRQGHLSVSRFTGNGSKARFAAPWSLGGTSSGARVDPGPPALSTTFVSLIQGFGGSSPTLAGSMPHRLRGQLTELLGVLDGPLRTDASGRRQVFMRLAKMSVKGGADAAERVAACLEAGFDAASPSETPLGDADRAQAIVAGLLVARGLAEEGADDRG